MVWETPDTYFPNDTLVKFGFITNRSWSTIVAKAPGGQRQSHPLQLQPKRACKATIIGYDPAAFKRIDDFLYGRMGMFKTYYVFNWYKADYNQAPRIPILAPVGIIGPGNELVLPFLGGTVTGVYIDGTLEYSIFGIGTDNGGPGGELRLISLFGDPTFTAGQTIQVEISGTRERIPVASTTDTDDFQFDWSAAIPPIETGLQVEEVF